MISALFDRSLSVYWQARAPSVFKLLNLRKVDRVLEIGCGKGLWTEIFAQSCDQVIALDIDGNKLAQAKKRCSPSVWFIVASADALPFAINTFDKVTCIDVIENVPNDCDVAFEISQVLRKGGALLITILRRDRWAPFGQLVFTEYFREYTSDEFQVLFSDQPLRVAARFEFYRRFGTVGREGQLALIRSKIAHWIPGLRLAIWGSLALLAQLDRVSRMPGGGLGLLLEKTSD